MKKKPFVSIIITYFNKKKFIKKTLKSILNQTYKNYEIIFVYDDNNKNDIPTQDGTNNLFYTKPFGLSFGQAMNIDVFRGSDKEAIGNYSKLLGDTSKYFGSNASTLSDSQIRQAYIGERLI